MWQGQSAGMIRDLRIAQAGFVRHPLEATRARGEMGPRARWLAKVVDEGYIQRNRGYLKRDLWDPQERRYHSSLEDRRKALHEPDPRPRVQGRRRR